MNKRQAIYLTVPFLSIIFLVGIINLIAKDKEISIAENRNLQQMPTIENIKQKNFTTTFETYYIDQFAGRDKLVKTDIKLQKILNKSTVKDHYITEDGWILGLTAITPKMRSDYKEDTQLITNYANKAKELGKKTYYIPLPHKVNTLDYKYPKYVDKSYGMENSKLLKTMVGEKGLETIDVGKYFVDNFNKKQLENFYFKTDHHWNSIGAYEGFRYIVEELDKKGDINVDLDKYKYKTKYIRNKTFMGSYNNNLYGVFSTDEDIPYVYMNKKYNKQYYEIKNKEFQRVEENYIIGDKLDQEKITYEGAYTGNHSYIKIINKKAITNKKVLIIRDSYQAPLTWLFSDIFEQVEIVDPRSTDMTYDEILKKSDSEIVMFMFNNGMSVYDILSKI